MMTETPNKSLRPEGEGENNLNLYFQKHARGCKNFCL